MPKVTVNREHLLAAVLACQKVTPSNTPKTILKLVRLSFGAESSVAATDSEISIAVGIDAESSAPCRTMVNPQILSGLLRGSSCDVVTLDVGEESTTVIAEGKYKLLHGDSPDNMPKIDGFPCGSFWTMPQSSLADAIARTHYATDPTSTKYALGGIAIFEGDGKLTFVATDTHQMSVVDVSATLTGERANEQNTVVPLKAMRVVGSLDGESTDIAISGNSIAFRCGHSVVCSLLIAARFPDYRRFVQKSSETAAVVAPTVVLQMLNRSLLFTDKVSVATRVDFANGSMRLSRELAETGAFDESVPCVIEGPDVTVYLDPRLMQCGMNAMREDGAVRIGLTDNGSAVKMESDRQIFVQMPMEAGRAKGQGA